MSAEDRTLELATRLVNRANELLGETTDSPAPPPPDQPAPMPEGEREFGVPGPLDERWAELVDELARLEEGRVTSGPASPDANETAREFALVYCLRLWTVRQEFIREVGLDDLTSDFSASTGVPPFPRREAPPERIVGVIEALRRYEVQMRRAQAAVLRELSSRGLSNLVTTLADRYQLTPDLQEEPPASTPRVWEPNAGGVPRERG